MNDKEKGYPKGPIHPWKYVLRWAEPEVIAYVIFSVLLIIAALVVTLNEALR